MKSLLTLIAAAVTFASLAHAQNLDAARMRERMLRDRMVQGGGYLVPGPSQPAPYPDPGRPAPYPGDNNLRPLPPHGHWPPPPRPPMPYPDYPTYPPSYPPSYYDVYGPAITVMWQDMGTFQAQKLIDVDVNIQVNGRLVNEIVLNVQDNPVLVRSALAHLSNGQVLEIRSILGTLHSGYPIRASLDYRNSVRVERIVLNIESPNLIGSRGRVNVQLGLAN